MAKKPSITTVASGYQSTTTINSNTQNLRDAFDNTLSLDGSTPNAMLADLDMNSNDILNVDKLYLSGLYIDGQPVAPGTLNYNGVIKETQTATSGQTVFNLATMTYNPGINSLSVYVDGVYQNPSTYTENNSTRITFSAGLHVGAVVDFVALSINEITGGADATTITYTPSAQSLYGASIITVKSALDQISNEGTGSSKVGFLQAGTGATNRTVQAKLRDTVSVKDFGADPTGATDSTTALKAAFDYAIPLGLTVQLEGIYLVSGPIQPYASRAAGSAHIVCKGNVIINVSGSATAFRDLFYLETTAANNCSITGGSLTIDCNNKAASGITFRHNAASQSGVVNISCPVEVLNCYNNDAASTYENQAIAVIGDYETVVMEQPRVVNVSRVAATGACKGIAVSAFTGVVTINQPYVANVLTGAGSIDADGIATFGKSLGTTYNARGGIVNINEPVFVDCQGRSFKSQCSDTTVFRPRVFRKNVVSITNGTEFDFQTGGQSLVIEPYYEYRLNGGTSPLGSSFSCIAFQQLTDDKQNVAKSIGGVLRTEVLVPRYSFTIYQSTALASYAEVSGLVIEPIGALTTKAIDRAIVEFRGDTVGAKSTKTTIVVSNCRGPIGAYAIGYTLYDGSVLTSKLSFQVVDNHNTLSATTVAAFSSLSGTAITAVEKFVLRNNYGFRSFLGGAWTFDFNNLAPGNLFTVDIAAVSATNAPAWGATGYAFIESLDQWFNTNEQHIRVTVNNAAAANTVFFTQGGATPTWGTIK